MSDYLGNLAARSLDQAAALQPRPLPLFAPAPRAGVPSLEQDDDLEQVDRAQPEGAPPKLTQPPIERRSAVVPAPPIAPAPPATQELPDQHAASQALLAHPPLATAPQPWSGQGTLLRPALEPAATRGVVERVVAPAPAAERVVERVQVASAPAAEQVLVERVVAPAPEPRFAARGEAPPIEQVVIEQVVSAAPTPMTMAPPATPAGPTLRPHAAQPIVAQPRVTPAQRASPAQPAPPAPEPAPTIQVTIGRIEVRAAPAQAQPARSARPAQPALSLDDYLRSRNGGGR